MRRNILITGGAGFIGSRLVGALLAADPSWHIWVLDNLHCQVHGQNPVEPTFPEQVRFIRGDIADNQVLRKVVREAQPVLVYHLAAETGTGQSYDEVARYCDVNVSGTAHLIEALRAESPDATRRVVLAASRAVYGEGAYQDATGRIFAGLPRQNDAMAVGDFTVPLPLEAALPGKEAASDSRLPPAPASVYASTKLMQEYLLKQAGEGAPWSATILRFQNVYGPGQSLRNPYTGVLSIFARQLLEQKTLAIYEDGRIARDFVFVDDVVDALVRAGQRDLAHGTTLDIGLGQAATILDVATLLIKYLDCPADRYEITGQFRTGDIRHACANIDAARAALDWSPKVDVEKGLAMLAEWARKQFAAGIL